MPRNLIEALNVTPDGKSPKNPFDLSSFHTFSQKGGQYEVVSCIDTVPDSDYRMSVDGFTRTLICNTANFARIKENYYFIHVPLGLINRSAYQTLVQRKEQYSALDFGITKFPSFNLRTVLKRLIEIANMTDIQLQTNLMLDVHGFNIAYGALRLLDMLGYGSYQDIVESTQIDGGLTVDQAKALIDNIPNYKPSANRIAAYQCTWYHFFRNDIYDCDISAKSFNFDDVTQTVTGVEPTSGYDILSVRQVDDFIRDCLQLRYVPYKKDIFTGSMPGTQFGPVSSVNMPVDFDSLSATFSGISSSFNGETSTDTGRHRYVDGSTGLYVNLDDMPTYDPDHQTRVIGEQYLSPAQPSDLYYSGIVYKPKYDEDTDNISGFNPVKTQSNHGVLDSHTHEFSGSVTPQGTVSLSGTTSGNSLFDVLSLVEAQAIQKWRQKSMLAGNRTTAQFKAHHGVVPRHLVDHLPDFIGSVDNVIQITEITSNSDTASAADESNLGEIAGRGYGASDNKTFEFHTDDYGILMLLHAVVPENTYSSFGLEVGNSLINYTDFFQSEYMNIGLQAVPNFMLNSTDYNAIGTDPFHPDPEGEGTEHFTSDIGILGYAPRYFGYKQYQSKVHGFFNPGRLAAYGFQPSNPFGYNDMQSFVLTRKDMVAKIYSNTRFNGFALTLSNLYVNPRIFDSIFNQAADDSEITDEFISHVKLECSALLPMSVVGLPQF